ncbi:MAG TPA: hypothetical protein GXZ48_07415, partial [Acholeplasmataceae bacterium]|nr:hypothetical protein [Acholeplasmataceae bacterium]
NYKLRNLNLLNKEFINNIKVDIADFTYDFLGNRIEITNLKFHQAEKPWIYEDLSTYGDVKNEWEINRLQFLFPLALNYYQNSENLPLIKKTINSWIKANPYNYGVNWFSNLEVAIRGVTLYFVFELTGLSLSQTLYEHGTHIYEEIIYSKYCIPNNHVLGEATALLLLGHAFNINKWINRARKLIKKFSYLINDEGISIEGSFSYHFFKTQMLLVQSLFDSNLKDKTIKALNFISVIIKPNGSLVNFGDNDEGYFYNPFWEKSIINIIKNLNIFNLKFVYKPINKNFYNYKDYKIIKDEKEGFYLLFSGQKEKYHSHSDNLNIELTLKNINILEDSGTYIYNGNKDLRTYFRSSLAHNTISFEGLDHSVQIGTFRWVKSTKALLSVDKNSFIGTLKTSKGKVKRTIEIEKNIVKIVDEIETKGKAIVNFHFGKEINLKAINDNLYQFNNIYIKFIGNFNITKKLSPISKSYNHITKRENIRIETFGNTKLETIIYIK